MTQPDRTNQLQQQAQAVIGEFQTNIAIATKPYGDLAKSFSAYIQITNALLAEKDAEIAVLKGKVVKEANKDVPLPAK